MPTTLARFKKDQMFLRGKMDERTPVVTNGLVAHYPFDGTDMSSVGYYASLMDKYIDTGDEWFSPVDAPIYTPNGVYVNGNNTCYLRTAFPTQPSCVDVDHKDLLAIEIEFNASTIKESALVSRFSGYGWAPRRAFVIRLLADGKIYGYVGSYAKNPVEYHANGWALSVTSNTTVKANEWHIVKIVYDKVKLYLYLDGKLEGTVDALPDVSLETTLGNGDWRNYRQRDFHPGSSGWFIGADGCTTSTAQYISDVANDPNAMVPAWSGVSSFHGYLRNFRLWKAAPATSNNNAVLCDNGIGLCTGETTTNLWTGNFIRYNNFSQPGEITKLDETYMGQPIYRLRHRPTTAASLSSAQTSCGNQGVYGSNRTYLANTHYASSIYWRPVNKPDTTVCGQASNISGWLDLRTEDMGNGWKRTTTYRTGATTDKTDNFFWSCRAPSLQLNEDFYVDFCCPQIEQGRTWSTAYTPPGTSRSTKGELQIMTPWLQNFAIAFEFKPDVAYYQYLTSAYNRMMLSMYDTDLTRRIDYADFYNTPGPSVTESFPFYDLEPHASWDNIQHHWHHNVDYRPGKWHTYIINKGADVLRITIMCEGVIIRDQSWTYTDSTKMSDFKLTKLVLGCNNSYQIWNGTFRNLSIYSRAIESAEMQRLGNVKKRFQATKVGNLLVHAIKERPVGIPSDAYYFPLNCNGKDITKLVSPSNDSGAIYTEDGAWVGQAFVNVADTSGTNDTYWNNTGTCSFGWATNMLTPIGNVPRECIKLTEGSSGFRFSFKPLTASTTYYVAASLYVDAPLETTTVYYREYHTANTNGDNYGGLEFEDKGVLALGSLPQKRWIRIYKTITTSSDHTQGSLCFYLDKPGSRVYIGDVQFVQRPFKGMPNVKGNPAAVNLAYNFNSSIGLNWGGDWSLVYFKKPLGTENNALTGYSIESIGCNGNSVGGSYYWFGKLSGGNAYQFNISGSTFGDFAPSDFFNKWQMCSLVRSGNNITYKVFNSDNTVVFRTGTTGATAENAFVTQHGYDFKLGGYDNVAPSNSYYRDLIVAKRALTDAELETIAKTAFRETSDSFTVSRFREGWVL